MKQYFEQSISYTIRHKWLVSGLVVLCVIASLLILLFTRYTNELHHLFPASGETGKTFRILNRSHLADTVQLEFLCCGEKNVTDFEDYLDSAAAGLSALPQIRQVVFRYRSNAVTMPDLTGLITSTQDPAAVLPLCDPDQAVRDAQKQLALPMCDVKALRNRAYPVMSQGLLQNLNLLNELGAMRFAPDLPYFADSAKKRAMILFETDIPIGDADAVRSLYAAVDQALSPLPDGLSYRIISGCNHTLGNESVLKRDATVAGILSVVFFVLIFLFFYHRDLRALWIPAIPLIASAPALGITALFFDEICLYVVGLGSCIVGLAIDQGIHIYSACREPGNKIRNAANLAAPLLLSMATSALVFVFLAFTGIEAYMQLAVFAGLSLLFSALLALFVLPALLPDASGTGSKNSLILPLPDPKYSQTAWGTLIFLLIVTATLLPNLRFDLSAESLDGTPTEVLEAEQDFNAVWRDPEVRTAILSATDNASGENALQKLEMIQAALAERGISLAMPPLPSEKRQAELRTKWKAPETLAAIQKLEQQTKTALQAKNMPAKFFDPFFTSLRTEKSDKPEFFRYIENKMIKERENGATALAMMAETPENIAAAQDVLRDMPDCAIISREAFSRQIRQDFGSRFFVLLCCSIAGSFLLAFLVFRNMRSVLLAMMPILFTFALLGTLGAVTGFKVNAASGFALVLLAGLAIDYGVYAVYQLKTPENLSIRRSVLLSAATTVAGAGALIFSRHPVLFGTGIVLSLGVTAACFCGLYLVPLLAGFKGSGKTKLFLLLLPCFLLTACASPHIPLQNFEQKETILKAAAVYPQKTPYKVRANAVWEIFGNELTAILVFELDPADGSVKASGILPAGTLLFRTKGQEIVLGNGIPENAKHLFKNIRTDLQRIFLLDPAGALAVRDGETILLRTKDQVDWELTGDALVRRSGTFPCRKWACRLENNGKNAVYENFDQYYTLRLSGVNFVTGGPQK